MDDYGHSAIGSDIYHIKVLQILAGDIDVSTDLFTYEGIALTVTEAFVHACQGGH